MSNIHSLIIAAALTFTLTAGCTEIELPETGETSQAVTINQGMQFQGMQFQGNVADGAQLKPIPPSRFKMGGVWLTGVDIANATLWGQRVTSGYPWREEVRFPDRYWWWDCTDSGCTYGGMEYQSMAGTYIYATATDGTPVTLYIYRVEVDSSFNTMAPNPYDPASDPRRSNDDMYQYFLYALPQGATKWSYLCDPGADPYSPGSDPFGPEKGGTFIDGTFDDSGFFYEDAGITFACNSGVATKCARGLGYKWWKYLPDATGTSHRLDDLYQTCTRALMADYCGDGESWTLNGTLISVWDNKGYNVLDNEPMFAPESFWVNPEGSTQAGRPSRLSMRRWAEIENAGTCPPVEGAWAAEDFLDEMASDYTWNEPDNFGVAVATSSHCTFNPCHEGPAGERLSRACTPEVEAVCDVDPACCQGEWDATCADSYRFTFGGTCHDPWPMPQ